MNLYKALKHDVSEGILKNKKYLLIPIIFLLQCGYIKSEIFNMGLDTNGTYMDYFFCCFKGGEPISRVENSTFPIFWLAGIFLCLFITNGFMQKDMEGFGLQILLRENAKKRWWLSKCIYTFLSCCVYFLIVNLSILIFSIFNDVSLSLNLTDSIMENVLESEYFFVKTDLVFDNWENIVMVYVMPFLAVCALSFLQLLFSLFVKSIGSFIIVNCYALLAVYIDTAFAFAGYGMLKYSGLYVENGLNVHYGVVICLMIIILSVLIGGYTFKKKDVI